MSCRIKLYETNYTRQRAHISLRSPTIQMIAVEQSSLENCCPVQANRRLIGGGYGADLPFIPGPFVYHIAIADTAQVYAGATVTNLNGATPGDFDVVLFTLPKTGLQAMSAGTLVAGVRSAVLKHPSWTADEKQGVLSVMNALGSLRGTSAAPVLAFVAHYERILQSCGVDPSFF